MERQFKIDNELTARFHFRVPVSTRLQAEKIAAQKGETLSDVLRTIVSDGLVKKQND